MEIPVRFRSNRRMIPEPEHPIFHRLHQSTDKGAAICSIKQTVSAPAYQLNKIWYAF